MSPEDPIKRFEKKAQKSSIRSIEGRLRENEEIVRDKTKEALDQIKPLYKELVALNKMHNITERCCSPATWR